MRQRVLGGIGVLWGGGILLSRVLNGPPQGNPDYVAGRNAALVFGALLLVVGAYYLLRKPTAK